MIADIDGQKAEQAARGLAVRGSHDAWGLGCDVSDESQVERTMDSVMERFSRVDIVVNNAGFMVFKMLEEQSEEEWVKVLRVNLLGTAFFIKHAFLRMRPGGSIVNVSSVHAEKTTPLVSSYAAAKAGIVSLTRSGAIEGKDKGIRVNAVIPGAIDTPMLLANPNIKSGAELLDPADIGKPDDVAAAILYLASDDASFVNGAEIRVDGGRLTRL